MKLALVLILLASSAAAETCSSRGAVIRILAERYNEVRVVRMMDTKDQLLEIFVSPAGTWTLTTTDAANRTCLLSSGDGMEVYEPIRPGNRT